MWLTLLCLPALASETGEVFVRADVDGVPILLDGVATGRVTPAVLAEIRPGTHTITVRDDEGCRSGEATVEVRAGLIERADIGLQPDTATFSLQTTPAAPIHLNGMDMGMSPMERVPVACGLVVLEAQAPGHRPYRQEVIARAGVERGWSVRLEPIEVATLVVGVSPLDADVAVDGRIVGTGPITLPEIEVGEHQVQVARAGFVPQDRAVELAVDSVVRLDFDLVEEVPLAARLERRNLSVAGGLTLTAATAFAASQVSWAVARSNYEVYAGLRYDQDPEAFYRRKVQTPRVLCLALAGSSGVLVAGAAGAWVLLPMVEDGEALVTLSLIR